MEWHLSLQWIDTMFLIENIVVSRVRQFQFHTKDSVKNTLIDILSGIRSACTYVGAKRLKSLSKCATFVRVNNTHNTIFGNE